MPLFFYFLKPLLFQRRGDVGAVYVKCQSHNGPVIQGILKRNFVINGIDNNIFKLGFTILLQKMQRK